MQALVSVILEDQTQLFYDKGINMLSLCIFLLSGCLPESGGDCSYDDYTGTCTLEENGSLTFTGSIDGSNVTIQEIEGYDALDELEVGESIECTFSFISEGTCSPCSIDVGSCSGDAYAVYLENRQE